MSDPRLGMTLEWARAVKLDLAAFRPYTQAVHAEVDDFLASLSDSDLDQPSTFPA